ncbi:hypothetical protein ABIE27_003450 [Paenibacillus sp. 4624]|uniref:hypothetical protein n=1 Tax=Paenibacillus sp. 4624 TaxID=3156453 RepID=UPI003D233B40
MKLFGLGGFIFLIFICSFVAVLFPAFFPNWVFLRLIFVGLSAFFLVIGMFHGMKSIQRKLKRLTVKFLFVILGFACLWYVSPQALAGVLDLGSYYKKEYVTVSGRPDYVGSMSVRKIREQTIEINGLELINTRKIDLDDRYKKMEIRMLPRSKYVISIKILE